MTLFFRIGLVLLLSIKPLVLLAADSSDRPLIARGDRNFPPYEFINEKGEPDGFNIDLLKAIAGRLEMDVDIDLDGWEKVREALAKGRIDLVTGMIRSAERERYFDFSITHAGVFYCLFVRNGSPIKNIEDARGKAILVHARAYSHDWLLERQITDRIVAVPSPQEALELLAQGRHDCAIIERLSALDLLKMLKIDAIAMAGPPLTCAPYAFAVKKGHDRLLTRLNEGLHLMHQNGTYENLYRKWFSVADTQARLMPMMRAGAILAAAIIGLAMAIFFWNLTLTRRVRSKTRALTQSTRRFEQFCDLLPQTVFETDPSGQITFLNRSGFDMLGLNRQAVLDGRQLSEFLPAQFDLDVWASSGEGQGKAFVIRAPGIDSLPALLYATPVVPGQPRRGLRGLLVDITFQKELEKQVIESQKMEALGRLAGGVAHDFNNIVTGIAGYAHLIRAKSRGDQATYDQADGILTGCDRAADLVRHFLDTAGRRQAEKQFIRLGRVISEIFKLLEPTYGRKITFSHTVDGSDDTVWVEPALVFQVLMNLCVNAAQAMSGSGGALTVGLMDDPYVGGSAETPQRVIFVSDTGPGIDPDLQARIFEPFFTTRGKANGSGIGLFVVHQTLSAIGGDIRVESEPDNGATFIVSLPVGPADGSKTPGAL